MLCNAIHALENRSKREKLQQGRYDTSLAPKTKDSIIRLIGPQCLVNIQLDNINVAALYDTGAQVCLVSERWVRRWELRNEASSLDSLLESRDLVLKTAVETINIPFAGWIVLQLRMPGWNEEAAMNVPFLITGDEIARPIIGSNVISEMLKEPEKYQIHPGKLESGFHQAFTEKKKKRLTRLSTQ